MSEQLELGVQAATECRFGCCNAPAPPLQAEPPYFDFPHAEDCPNPSLGTWFDRYGRTYRRLHCITIRDGVRVCPYGGRNPEDPKMVDPYNGECCLALNVEREPFPAPRETDCSHGCCKAGDEGLFSEAVPA